MATNLLDSVKGLFTSDLVSRASSALGESEGAVQKALSGAIPSVFAGVLNKVSEGEASKVYSLAKETANNGIAGDFGRLFGSGQANGGLSGMVNLAGSIFGDKQVNVARLLSGFCGVKESSANAVIALVGPAVMSMIGKHINDDKMNTSGFLSLLGSQKSNIIDALPSGLNLAGALGLSGLNDIGTKFDRLIGNVPNGAKQVTQATNRATRWLWPAAAVIAVVALGFYFVRSGAAGKIAAKVKEENLLARGAADISAVKEFFKVKLPNEATLDAYKGGVEDNLVTCLNDPNCAAGDDSWFDFDHLTFSVGSSVITPESQRQINNIVAILKAYPSAQIKIGGYTDRAGTPAENRRLSQDRADAVAAALMGSGANPNQISGAEGYGSAWATMPADAPDQMREKDRRISIQLSAK